MSSVFLREEPAFISGWQWEGEAMLGVRMWEWSEPPRRAMMNGGAVRESRRGEAFVAFLFVVIKTICRDG